ncbi:MAG: RNA-directed DNA polymerase [Clostridia bacterium]|nr:RNA-directed DNA polymerase [Clostridia bacterium]
MTSEERRSARRARRERDRAKKRDGKVARYDDYERVISANSLIKAALLSRHGVGWKASVQRYMMNLLRNVWETREKLRNGESIVQGFICFSIFERGKQRFIRSVHIKERVVQRSLCDNALVPVLSRSLVYDNGASMKNKGIHFAIRRCRCHLQRFYRQNGRSNDDYILLTDFSGYFDNIQHGPIKAMLMRAFHDKKLRWLIWTFVKSFGRQSLGIGSQVSQILAVAYANPIDHYAHEMLGLTLSGRYMDDAYYIHTSREYLQSCLPKIKAKCDELGIALNPRKTQIIPLKRFTFLKVRFYLTITGKVVMKPYHESVVRMRRKLKAFRGLVDLKEMGLRDVQTAYESWRGYQEHLDSYRTVKSMDELYYKLFGLRPNKGRK